MRARTALPLLSMDPFAPPTSVQVSLHDGRSFPLEIPLRDGRFPDVVRIAVPGVSGVAEFTISKDLRDGEERP